MNFQSIGIKRVATKIGKMVLGFIKWVVIVIFSFSLILDFYHFFYIHPSTDFFDTDSLFICELGEYLDLEIKPEYKHLPKYNRVTHEGIIQHCVIGYTFTHSVQRKPSCVPYVELPLEIKHCRSQHYIMFKRSCYMPMFLNEFFEKKFSEKRGEKFYPYDQPCIDPPSESWEKRYRTCRDLPRTSSEWKKERNSGIERKEAWHY